MKQATCNPTQTPVPQADGWMCTDALSTVRHRVCRAAARAMQQGATSRHPHALMRPAPVCTCTCACSKAAHAFAAACSCWSKVLQQACLHGWLWPGQGLQGVPLKPVQCYISRVVCPRVRSPRASSLIAFAFSRPTLLCLLAPQCSPFFFDARILLCCQLRSEQAKAP